MGVAKEFDITEARRRLEEKKRKTKWWQIRRRLKLMQAERILEKLEALSYLGVEITFIEEEERDGREY